jgi:hypothetical protein
MLYTLLCVNLIVGANARLFCICLEYNKHPSLVVKADNRKYVSDGCCNKEEGEGEIERSIRTSNSKDRKKRKRKI